jgi:FMN phosphatase YigB (HAD superfamily)
MKPSLNFLRRAYETFPASSHVLFVGDSHERDVVPAKALGWAAAWIAPENQTSPVADATVSSLLDLPGLEC